MELRDYFAAQALFGYMSTSFPAEWLKTTPMEENDLTIAEHCYAIADAMMAARCDVWIEWNGGDECPVPDGKNFSIRFRCGKEDNAALGGIWDWTHEVEPNDYDIVAYRIDK